MYFEFCCLCQWFNLFHKIMLTSFSIGIIINKIFAVNFVLCFDISNDDVVLDSWLRTVLVVGSTYTVQCPLMKLYPTSQTHRYDANTLTHTILFATPQIVEFCAHSFTSLHTPKTKYAVPDGQVQLNPPSVLTQVCCSFVLHVWLPVWHSSISVIIKLISIVILIHKHTLDNAKIYRWITENCLIT